MDIKDLLAQGGDFARGFTRARATRQAQREKLQAGQREQQSELMKMLFGEMIKRGQISLTPEGLTTEQRGVPEDFYATEYDVYGQPTKLMKRVSPQDMIGGDMPSIPGIEPSPAPVTPEAKGVVLGKQEEPTGARYEVEQFKVPTPGGDITYKRKPSPEEEKKKLETEQRIKAKADIFKLSEKNKANFGRAMGMFSTIIAQAKGMQTEQKEALEKIGIKTTGLGLLPGTAGALAVKTKRPGFGRTAAFRGQRRETAISLNSILTGQNRVIRSVVQMIYETLPDPTDPEGMMATKLTQSITNAYRLVKAFERAGYTPEELQKMTQEELSGIDASSLLALYVLTPNERKELKAITKNVLKTSAMPPAKFGREEEPVKEEEPLKLFNVQRIGD